MMLKTARPRNAPAMNARNGCPERDWERNVSVLITVSRLKKLRALARDFFSPPSKIPNELTLTTAYSADEERRVFNLFMRNWGFKIVSEGPFSDRDLRLFLPEESGPLSYGLLPEGDV